MTADVRWCYEDQALDEVMAQMGDNQIRRVPVVSHDDQHRLLGIVSLADLATRSDNRWDVEDVVEMVSSPSDAPSEPAAHAGTGDDRGMPVVHEAGVDPAAGPRGGDDTRAPTGKNAAGVPEALTGLDQRSPGGKLEEVGVTGQPRIDNTGEPLRNAGSDDPADNASLERDVDGRKPPSTPSNAV
jgi:CBS domain-containing protein